MASGPTSGPSPCERCEVVTTGLRRDVDVRRRNARRLWHGLTAVAKSFDVEGDRLEHLSLTLLQRRSGRDTAWEIGRVRRVIGVITALDHDQIAPLGHRFCSGSPACLTMLAQVLGRLPAGLPAIVTSPGRFGCLYCRWLPRVRASSQPAASTRR